MPVNSDYSPSPPASGSSPLGAAGGVIALLAIVGILAYPTIKSFSHTPSNSVPSTHVPLKPPPVVETPPKTKPTTPKTVTKEAPPKEVSGHSPATTDPKRQEQRDEQRKRLQEELKEIKNSIAETTADEYDADQAIAVGKSKLDTLAQQGQHDSELQKAYDDSLSVKKRCHNDLIKFKKQQNAIEDRLARLTGR